MSPLQHRFEQMDPSWKQDFQLPTVLSLRCLWYIHIYIYIYIYILREREREIIGKSNVFLRSPFVNNNVNSFVNWQRCCSSSWSTGMVARLVLDAWSVRHLLGFCRWAPGGCLVGWWAASWSRRGGRLGYGLNHILTSWAHASGRAGRRGEARSLAIRPL